MTKKELLAVLHRESTKWESRTYDELCAAVYPVSYNSGDSARGDYWQVEVSLLEKKPEYVHIGIAVDDGGWRAFVPLSTSIIVEAVK